MDMYGHDHVPVVGKYNLYSLFSVFCVTEFWGVFSGTINYQKGHANCAVTILDTPKFRFFRGWAPVISHISVCSLVMSINSAVDDLLLT